MNSDEAIDRVLAGLRDAQLPDMMEQRIMMAAQTRKAQRSGWTVASLIGSWPVAVAGTVLIALSAAIAVHRRTPVRQEVAETMMPLPPLTKTPEIPSTAATTTRRTHGNTDVARDRRTRFMKPDPLSVEDALALSEMLAPSRPAPPLPLTYQEKLLAEAVHQAIPAELASLRPEFRARQMELSKAEFRDFFEPLAAKDNE